MTTGSKVERIAAPDGPTRRRPAKNNVIAATVETTASSASQARPRRADASRMEVARETSTEGEGRRGTGAEQRAQHEGLDALGDALAS